MSRAIKEERLLMLLKSELSQQPIPEQGKNPAFAGMTMQDWTDVMSLVTANRIGALMLNAIHRNPGIPVPMTMGKYLEQDMMRSTMGFYTKLSLLMNLLATLKQENIRAYVIKGVTLNVLYPTPESRTFSDIDLYVPDQKDFDRLTALFRAAGYQKKPDDMTDYHESYLYEFNGASCDVEVHYRLSTSWGNGSFDDTLTSIYAQALQDEEPEKLELMGVEVPALPVTMEAFYILMHLFQHFMNKGFGLRLFMDWVAFWRSRGIRVNVERFRQWIGMLRMGRFVDTVNLICVRYFGMEQPACGWFAEQPDEALAEELLTDVFIGGEFGKQDHNRMVVTSRKPGVRAYLLELHRQTKKHYPKASKIIPILPVLWVVTGLIFQYNNMVKRKISLGAIFASSNERNRLVQKMGIFDES